jgi:hypothetical protein
MLLESEQCATEEDFFTMTIAARSGDGETPGELGLSSAGGAVTYGFDAAPGSTPLFSADVKLNHWHNLELELDYTDETTKVRYYLDGKLIGAIPTTSTSNVLLRGALVTYALPDDEENERAHFTARFNNFKVSTHGRRGDADE